MSTFHSVMRVMGLALLLFVPPSARAQRLEPSRLRNGDEIRRVFAPVVEEARQATVRVIVDGVQVALGTVIDDQGHVLTKASEIRNRATCEFPDGSRRAARLIGIESQFDLGMLQIERQSKDESFPSFPLKQRSDEVLGAFVATPGVNGLPEAVGVVSAPARRIRQARGVLGISIMDDERGPQVTEIFPNSGADRAGLKAGDVIVEIAGRQVSDRRSLSGVLGSFRPGDLLSLRVLRGDQRIVVRATMGYPIQNLFDRQSLQNALADSLSARRDGFPEVFVHDSMLRTSQCGGILVDLDGEPIGINIARAGRTASYAVPIRSVLPLLADLRSGKLAPMIPIGERPEPPPLPEPAE